MSIITNLTKFLPEVKSPKVKHLQFKTKLKWTLIVLVSYFILGIISLWGLGENALEQFDYLAIILGAQFGSIISLGIGPIVTASIVLQLLNGSGILKLKTETHEGRAMFQGLQKILTIFFIIFEAIIYVFMGGLSPQAGISHWVLVFQLFLGGMLILYLDEICSKWGFGSGVSLFIAAGVSAEIFVRALSPLTTTGLIAFGTGQAPIGKIFVFFYSLVSGNPTEALLALSAIIFTVVVFAVSVYTQAMKVEIPLSFGRVRGYGMRWPLRFIYTSNIPVILVAALLANIQLWASLLERWGYPILGTFTGNVPTSGLVAWIYNPDLIGNIIRGSFTFLDLSKGIVYVLIMSIGAIIFSVFWMQTSGMDARSQAKQIMASGLQIPGFRRDERILEQILKRYILPLTVMGALAVGLLAALADLTGALSRGTGILLTVMIIYNFYEKIASDHMADMYPGLRKFMAK
ncbi:preprotein translocase subunit SecY [Candidatus Woesearchaeota archaeon]|nr:preprotein translocase subunit SecY [Candidatus Woesearchaeota archaeon]